MVNLSMLDYKREDLVVEAPSPREVAAWERAMVKASLWHAKQARLTQVRVVNASVWSRPLSGNVGCGPASPPPPIRTLPNQPHPPPSDCFFES